MKKIETQYHSSIETLEYRVFLKISKSGNLKLLTIQGEPDSQILVDAWSNILSENEKDTGIMLLTSHLQESDMSMIQQAKMMRLICAYHLMVFQDEYGIKIANELKLKINDMAPDSINKVRAKFNQINTQIQLNTIYSQKKYKTDKEQTFESIIAQCENILKRSLPRDITVKEFNANYKVIKEIISQYEKNGRESKSR
jgi:hypothetical protein